MAFIRPLPEVAAAQVKASVLITSLHDVVLGLVENSLDSAATRIDVEVDFEKGFCSVEDDGAGIAPADFSEHGGLGKVHHTSKPEENLSQHGSKGIFLWAVSMLANMTIISLQETWSTPSSMTIHHGRTVHRETSLGTRPLRHLRHGTRVDIRDLFGNMPVRAMQRPKTADGSTQRAWKRILNDLTGALLAWGKSIEVSFRSLNGVQKVRVPNNNRPAFSSSSERASDPPKGLFHIPTIKNILLNGASIDPQYWPQWTSISAQTKQWTIRAILSRQPCSSRDVQFISLGVHHIKEGDSLYGLYEEVNRVFELSSFGAFEESAKASRKEPGTRGKGVDRWPMFFIRIDSSAGYSRHPYNSSSAETEESIVPVLRALMESFLSHNSIRVWDAKTKHQSTAIPSMSTSEDTQVLPQLNQRQDASTSSISSRPTASTTSENLRTSMRQGRRAISSLRIADSNLAQLDSLQDRVQASDETAVDGTPDTQTVPFTNTANTIEESNIAGQNRPEDSNSLNPERTDLSPISRFLPLLQTDTANIKLSRTIAEMSEAAKKTPWASNLVARWENPVFNATERSIPKLPDEYCISAEGLPPNQSIERQSPTVLSHSSMHTGLKISRTELLNAEVISQVDRKFILIKIQPLKTLELLQTGRQDTNKNRHSEVLILIDQHAADERVRVEALLAALCQPVSPRFQDYRSPLGYVSAIDTEVLSTVIGLDLEEQECGLFRNHAKYFARWGVLYTLRHDRNEPCVCQGHTLFVLSLPPLISERCRAEPRLLAEFLRREVWALRDRPATKSADYTPPAGPGSSSLWSRIHSCPEGILDLLNSRACRSAIMFNDDLSLLRCKELVQQLGRCRLPFQCAHGRPSMVPVANLEAISFDWSTETGIDYASNENSLHRSFASAWKDLSIAEQL